MKPSIKIRSAVGALLLCWLGAAVGAGNDVEHERFRQQRQQVEASYQASLLECQDKFQVTDCELAAKAKRRAALAEILKREQALDLAIHQEQARSNRERLAVKQMAHEGKAELQAAAASSSEAKSGSGSKAASPSAAKKSAAPASSVDLRKAKAVRQADEAKTATQQRISKAREHEAQVRAREADLLARGKRAAPLPVPGASSDLPGSSPTR